MSLLPKSLDLKSKREIKRALMILADYDYFMLIGNEKYMEQIAAAEDTDADDSTLARNVRNAYACKQLLASMHSDSKGLRSTDESDLTSGEDS